LRFQKFIPKLPIVILTLFVMLVGVLPAHAMDQASIDNVQAAMRTLSFLESLPKDGPIIVGVLYSSDTPDAQAVAEATAQLIRTMHGPNSRTLQPLVLSTNALAQFQGHLDVLWLTAGVCKHAVLIVDSIRHQHVVSICDDPQCADSQCCVIAVRAGQRVEISLNTALADAAGAHFSLVFTMVVKRK
jgi:YfiR/HmsC-like